jgi:hypothetical protein
MTTPEELDELREVVRLVKELATKYYRLTGRSLGATGEIGEVEVVEKLGLEIAPVRTTGYDALRGKERIQIKTRAADPGIRSLGRMSRIKIDAPVDFVMLAILEIDSMDLKAVYEAPYAKVEEELRREGPKGNKARQRGQLAVKKFISMARKVWPPAELTSPPGP